jgi:hypothetical protein
MKREDVYPGLEVVVIKDFESTTGPGFYKAWSGQRGRVFGWPPDDCDPNCYYVPVRRACAPVKFKNGRMEIPLTHLDFANILDKLSHL